MTVDTSETAQEFVRIAAQDLRKWSAQFQEFYIGEFLNVFKDALVTRISTDVADAERTVASAQAEADTVTAELEARMSAARAANDRAAEHKIWKERDAAQAALQAKVDAASKELTLMGLRMDTFKNLASALGIDIGLEGGTSGTSRPPGHLRSQARQGHAGPD